MMRAQELTAALNGRWFGSYGMARCANHDDSEPSLAIRDGEDGRLLVHCHAGCNQGDVIGALRARGLWPEPERKEKGRDRAPRTLPPVKPATVQPNPESRGASNGSAVAPGVAPGKTDAQHLTLEALAEAKHLPADFLARLGCRNVSRGVEIPYHNENGDLVGKRYRLALTGNRFLWRKGDRVLPYGLHRLRHGKAAGWLLIVEGESDAWTAWHHGLPALGIPGKSTWCSEWAAHLDGLDAYLWQEPDAADLVERMGADIPALRVIRAPEGIKDLSDAHLQGHDVRALVERHKATARPAAAVLEDRRAARAAELFDAARSILDLDDPLPAVERAIRAQGYGGSPKAAVLAYLAATGRVLAMGVHAMPAHLLLLGAPSIGKSATWQAVAGLLPPEAYHVIDAGSPRVLIYDDADLRHRVVVFAEADSIPAGEDNPAASAVRNLLQDGRLHYKVVVRDPKTGDFTVRNVCREGPSVLVTTAVRSLGGQLMSRLFVVEVPDDHAQVRAALGAIADIELDGADPPDPALVAFQSYLQALAPIDVVVPFVRRLSDHIGRQPAAPRVLRDFARLLSLIKAVAVLRLHHRDRDAGGRLVATVEDYATVYRLVADVYEASVTGAGDKIRETVVAVAGLLERRDGEPVTVAAVADALGVNKGSASRRVGAALRGGWMVNQEQRKGRPADLDLGDALPDKAGLPDPEVVGAVLHGCATADRGATARATAQGFETEAVSATGCTVAPLTDESHQGCVPAPPVEPDDEVAEWTA